jgi:farnesyl-diphosphate farnesyltransferase
MPQHEIGIRKFCLWAIGMAVLTLQKINKTRNYSSAGDVKISRESVRKIILVSNATLRSNFLLKTFFKFAARGLPAPSSLKSHLQPASRRRMEGRSFENQNALD